MQPCIDHILHHERYVDLHHTERIMFIMAAMGSLLIHLIMPGFAAVACSVSAPQLALFSTFHVVYKCFAHVPSITLVHGAPRLESCRVV
jgi:hypothetical protein